MKINRAASRNLSLKTVLVFEDFGFEDNRAEKPYQIYYFLEDKKGDKYIAEGDMWLRGEEFLSVDLDFMHPAVSLNEYIRKHSDKEMIESHPPTVSKFLEQ